MHGRKGPSKIAKKTGKQSTLQEPVREEPLRTPEPQASEQMAPHEMKLEPIKDKRSYDLFIKTIALRIYHEFETALRTEGVERPEISLVGLDCRKAATPSELRMADYLALNSRLIVEKAFVDLPEFAVKHMPRVMRDIHATGGNNLAGYVEGKVQRDLLMEIRAIAMVHIPDGERYRYVSKLKEF
ncbi:MAG: hypothetical protein A4E28_02239 [Methanocella sp. PtaU1.Bin125]|nr:MAG: hypothetical protein A4E28_02239 [Methanocella sp. PtaU1.Bin125]